MEKPKPEYAIGEKVFLLENNKIVEKEITGIRLVILDKRKLKDPIYFVQYYFTIAESLERVSHNDFRSEYSVFRTKEKLIEKLSKEDESK